MGPPAAACVMDVALCARHIGAQPGGGICAICLQERLIQLWRGEGNFTWGTEEFSVTPPLCKTPSAMGWGTDRAGDAAESATTSGACFPVIFRVRQLQCGDAQRDAAAPAKSREKRDRISDRSSERQQQFSGELKSMVKEMAASQERKKGDKAGKKRAGTTTTRVTCRGSISSGSRQQQEEVAEEDGTQGRNPASQGRTGDASAPATLFIPKSKESIVEEEADEDQEARYGKSMCFGAVWPAIANLKWARLLVSPILSSNKIAPSKSDLLSKIVNGMPTKAAAVAAAEEARAESGRNCETSGSTRRENLDFDLDDLGQSFGVPGPAVRPPRYVLPAADEDGTGIELDKEAKQRMEASRITVLTWLQSLPSPKAGHMAIAEQNHSSNSPPYLDQSISPPPGLHLHLVPHPFPGGEEHMSLGNGVLEMCDEEDMELDCVHSRHTDGVPHPETTATTVTTTTMTMTMTMTEGLADPEPPPPPPESLAHVGSFGKFLRSPVRDCAPTRMADMEIPAQ